MARRGHHVHRAAIAASNAHEMAERLEHYIDEGSGVGIATGTPAASGQQPVFVFTGMGPQWWAMGRELLACEPVFRQQAEACDAIFRRLAGWSILDEMLADEADSRMADTEVAQPANFVLQVSLAALWRSRGVLPSAVVGHSVGEVSASHVAGVLDLESALRVSYHRSRIQKKAAGIGGMLAVGLPAAELQPYLDRHAGCLSLAAANSPAHAAVLDGHRPARHRRAIRRALLG
jgi:acyl transferase domain-containing protein